MHQNLDVQFEKKNKGKLFEIIWACQKTTAVSSDAKDYSKEQGFVENKIRELNC